MDRPTSNLLFVAWITGSVLITSAGQAQVECTEASPRRTGTAANCPGPAEAKLTLPAKPNSADSELEGMNRKNKRVWSNDDFESAVNPPAPSTATTQAAPAP